MTETLVTVGRDACVDQARPTENFGSLSRLFMRSFSPGPTMRIFLGISPGDIAGRTVLSATLSVRAASALVAQTITVQPCEPMPNGQGFSASRITWNNQPDIMAPYTDSVTIGATPEGDRIEIDVTELVQLIAHGEGLWGWRITTNATTPQRLFGFDSGDGWQLEVVLSDQPVTPTQLVPDGGVVGRQKPVVSFDYNDFSGTADLAAAQVQINDDLFGVNEFDTGEVATTVPEVDLSQPFARSVASVTTTNASTSISFPSGTITSDDVGAAISGTGIPVGATITTPITATTATLSAAATASGTITATVTRTYAGLADGATTHWRVRTKSTQGTWSEWSDWASMERRVKPTLTVTSPTGGTVGDATPMISANVSAGVIKQYHLEIANVGDLATRRYVADDKNNAASFSHEVPFTYKKGVVFPDSGTYRLEVRAWDRLDRQYDGDPPYLSQVIDFAIVGAGSGATTLTVTPMSDASPGVTLNWTRAAVPDAWYVFRNGKRIAHLSIAETEVSPGNYEWVDYGAPPNTEATWSVAALFEGSESTSNASATGEARVEGAWLVSEAHGQVVIHGDNPIELTRVDRRAILDLPYRPEPVIILGALGVLQGKCDGVLTLDRDGVPVGTKRAVIEAIRKDPLTPVQLIYGQTSIRVLLTDVTVVADAGMIPAYGRDDHKVTFGCFQVGGD